MIRSLTPCLLALALTASQGLASVSAAPDSAASVEVALLPCDGASLSVANVSATDQNGRTLRLADFAGHPLIISMFYGTCPYACPMLMSEIKKIERRLDPAVRAETRVLLVSFDPARDTTAALAALADRHHVDGSRWHLARASEHDVRQLAALLGISYRKLASGEFNHSSVITVLDGRGVPRFREDGLGDPPDAAAHAVTVVARETR